jgi:hypothetical protein
MLEHRAHVGGHAPAPFPPHPIPPQPLPHLLAALRIGCLVLCRLTPPPLHSAQEAEPVARRARRGSVAACLGRI